MSDKYGILIAEDGKTIRNARNKVDSRRRTLILDMEADPKHMGIIETTGGNSYTDSGPIGRSQDILFRLNHKLGYAPLVDCYFYVLSYDGNTSDLAAGGYGNQVFFLSGSGGTVADIASFEADTQEFRLVHNFDAFGFTTGFVSTAQKYLFRVKFYIYSIDTGRAVNYGYPFDGSGIVIP